MILGCIGDDFTGSSDIANTLAKGGMRTTQYVGIPDQKADKTVQAGVVSLKTRTIPVQDAIDQSLAAAQWLLDQGCQQLFFKYCSTFDSTPDGNIGPVTEALMALTGETKVVMCPAFPTVGRTVYQGHLFVFDTLLSDSGMKDHPLTPMTDPDLRRWLALQASGSVSHLPWPIVAQGRKAISAAVEKLDDGMIIADAIRDEDLMELGHALKNRKLLTGGSGLALGLPEAFLSGSGRHENSLKTGSSGKGVVLSGSCSIATRGQIQTYLQNGRPGLEVDARDILDGNVTSASALKWVQEQTQSPLVYTSAEPATITSIQSEFGTEKVANAVESFFADLATLLIHNDITRIVTAGGETSGAVVLALDLEAMEIGVEIAPGVPAMHVFEKDIHFALKSGNFGGPEFFEEALLALGAN